MNPFAEHPTKFHLSVSNVNDKQSSPIVSEYIFLENQSINIFLPVFQYKTLDISRDLIVYSTEKNTGALFIYRRDPYRFFKAVPGNVIRGTN